MTLFQRIGYYLGGFSIGLIILAFFLSGKKTSCSYGPESRVLKNINSKNVTFSEAAQAVITEKHLDTVVVNHILRKGDVDFSKSDTKSEPCKTYVLNGTSNKKAISLTVKNCETTATVEHITVQN
ncbi:hypothetical protein [Formosa sp. S-31]|uniref:hypothetical protein n=1 Tax=Formosa sp. S-31 TaxID=2790949 RepID=UPI003EBD59B9